MDVVEVNRLRVRTEVGFSPHELGKRQELNITLHLRPSVKKAGESDLVEDTINYKNIAKDVLFHVENKKYNLIETVATDIARICVARYGIISAKVTVEKPNALRFAESSSVTIERCWEDLKWHEAHVSIGSNIEPEKNLPLALNLLKKHTKIINVSKAFKTTPVGLKEQADFINMAVVIRTKLDLSGLKNVISEVEKKVGRIRTPNNKNAPRTIDLDISFWDNMTCCYKTNTACSTNTWSIPDPDILKHAHVIIPLADVTPEFIHPLVKKPLKVLASELCGQDNFRSFFPVVAVLSAKEILSDGVEHWNVPGAIIIKSGNITPEPLANGSLQLGSKNPVALITGAAKRLGAHIAMRLHDIGYNVMIHYNTSAADALVLVEKMNSFRSGSAKLIHGDLAREPKKTAERIIEDTLGAWGRLNLLVNNASQFHSSKVGNVTEEEWNENINVNLSTPFFLSQAAFPSLKESGGNIINLLDIYADKPLTNHSMYCISKAGLLMCTMALALEFAPFVRVNGISPGAVLWPDEKRNNDAATACITMATRKADILSKVPMNRKGEPGDVVKAAEFLSCASSAGYITGQVIRVDGGRSLSL